MQPRLLHQTDLFRPHNDPDDHWDLACAFALARRGLATLAGVLIDHPPGPPVLNHASDPDVGAVAQLSHLSGIHPPVAIGSPEPFGQRRNPAGTPPPTGVSFVLDLLERSSHKLAISIVGSARDIAEAIAREPELFALRCDRIYLSAGSGCPDPARVPSLEWNVALDPLAYVQILRDAPCPIYWLPCLEDEDRVASAESKTWASHFRFRQGEILDDLPAGLRSYFGFMFEKRDSSFWLSALRQGFDATLDAQSRKDRMMYSTALFFDVAGLGVTREGELRPQAEQREDWVYRFEPVAVECTDGGETRWRPANGPTNRHLLHVLDTAAYPAAMTRAMRNLLLEAFA